MLGSVTTSRETAGPLANASMYMVEVRAKDWNGLCRFYGATLGLPEGMRDEGAGFAMFGKREPYVAVVRKGSGDGASRVIMDFVVDDLDGALEQLTGKGVAVLSPAKPSPEGYRIARIADPEGNEIHLFEWTKPPARAR